MFIKPLDVHALPVAHPFQDRAGNAHFALQSKLPRNPVQSLFSGLAAFSLAVSAPSSPADAAFRRSLLDYDHRIVLRCPSRKLDYIVAVDESFEKIHADWNWVEENLFLKLQELEASKSKLTPEQIDNLLIKQFDELTEEAVDPRAAEVQAKLQQVLQELVPTFPALAGEVLLNFYACTYWITDQVSARGQLCITRNYVCFTGTRPPGVVDPLIPERIGIRVAFKDVMSIDLVDANRVLLPDSIQISTKQQNHTFSLYFHRKEVYRVLCVLANSAMNRLIKGAENSMSALADMFGKGNVSGDLSANVGSRGGGILTMGRSRDEFSFFSGRSASVMSDVLDETDFTEQRFDKASTPAMEDADDTVDSTRADGGDSAADNENSAQGRGAHSLVRYAAVSAATIKTIAELDVQTRNLEFRQLFRLPFAENVVLEEAPVYYYHKAAATSFTGRLFLSPNFFNFIGLGPAGGPGGASAAMSLSLLFDSPSDPSLIMVLPYPHIVSVKKQPPTALPAAGKLSAFSLSGYLVLSTKNKQESWLSFANVKSRDRVADMLLQRMKQVDFQFDDDIIIGGGARGAGAAGSAGVAGTGASPSTPGTPNTPPVSSPMYRPTHSVNSTGSLDEYTRPQDPSSGGASSSQPERKKQLDATALDAWNTYFEANGRDVCMVRDLRPLRDLVLRTDGIPTAFRGDVWMICAGARYSRPDGSYYTALVADHVNETSAFAEEIEKDVRRSLPEHPAYQTPMGIDALRRVLTAYSWRNPAIGYAQALNILSAVLLLHLKEEDAFWMLCIIVERILPDHYSKTLVGSVVDQSVFSRLVELHLPLLWAHLTKLYMDLSTISVPWFMCLFLNSVPLRLGVKFLDAFFIDGPKFLFWVALAILKINEPQLVTRGRDDDIFMQIMKNFFQRLGAAGDGEGAGSAPAMAAEPVDPSTLTGRALYNHLMQVAYAMYSPIVTSETIDALRARYRLTVVHQMEDTSRKSQIRTLCEQVSLTFDEVAIVYDEVRGLEFLREEEEEDPKGAAAALRKAQKRDEDAMRETLIGFGGWGMARKGGGGGGADGGIASRKSTRSKKRGAATQRQQEVGQKTVCLCDFRKVFGVVSPWQSGPTTASGGVTLGGPPQQPPTAARRPSMANTIAATAAAAAAAAAATPPAYSDVHIGLTDRIYFYCALHYNFLRTAKQRGGADASSPLAPLAYQAAEAGGNASGAGPGPVAGAAEKTTYIVDLATMVHILDIIMRQPLHSRLRFLFEIHDVDGDGFLDKDELKAVMDSLLEMFERARRTGGAGSGSGAATGAPPTTPTPTAVGQREDEELYLGAVSQFLNTALKLGNNKPDTPALVPGSLGGAGAGAGELGSSTSAAQPIKQSQAQSHTRTLRQHVRGTSTGGLLSSSPAPSSPASPSSSNNNNNTTNNSNAFLIPAPSSPRPRSASPAIGGGGSSTPPPLQPPIAPAEDFHGGTAFRLSFNEFLLAVLSQSVFVQYFERVWTLARNGAAVEVTFVSKGDAAK
ncbi:rab-GTPase-TBC domain-containing protein [Geranomyces variabilis]|nr:rab-GTPase-TBC domain-containing protein [Geranomyces variabilis]